MRERLRCAGRCAIWLAGEAIGIASFGFALLRGRAPIVSTGTRKA